MNSYLSKVTLGLDSKEDLDRPLGNCWNECALQRGGLSRYLGQSNGHASEHRLASLSVKESGVQGPKVAWSFYNPSCLDSLRSVDSSSWGLCYVRSSKNEIGPQQHTGKRDTCMCICMCALAYVCVLAGYMCTYVQRATSSVVSWKQFTLLLF